MIIITGAAGFIGSCLIRTLNENGFDNLVLVDDFSNPVKNKNIESKSYVEKVERMQICKWIHDNKSNIDFIFHIGARTDTTEFNTDILDKLNLEYSKFQIFKFPDRASMRFRRFPWLKNGGKPNSMTVEKEKLSYY